VELLLQEHDPEVRDRLIASSVRETARAGRLITELLQMARLDRAGPPTRAPGDIVALCEHELERARGFAPHLDIDLVGSSAPSGPVPIAADEVRDAVANMVDNARRHARQQVRVTVEEDDRFVTIRVDDDGPGVPERSEEVVFERFATLDGKGGSGLGLPIARAIARSHGGDLTYDDGGFVLRLAVSG
jgi:signal transduction histidine kinase